MGRPRDGVGVPARPLASGSPSAPVRSRRTDTSLARRIMVLNSAVMFFVMAVVAGFAYLGAREQTDRWTVDWTSGIAISVARSGTVTQTLSQRYSPELRVARPSSILQPYSTAILGENGIFTVISLPDGTMLTHPFPTEIGNPYPGPLRVSPDRKPTINTFVADQGAVMVVTTPVLDSHGYIVGWVSAGVLVDSFEAVTAENWLVFGGIALVALGLGLLASHRVTRWVRRQTLDKGADELVRMFRYYDAVLNSAQEGILILDLTGRIVMINQQARSMLGLDENALGKSLEDADVPPSVVDVLSQADSSLDALAVTNSRILEVSQRAALELGKVVGTVLTLRDHTELESLVGELDRVQDFTETLRTQAHESANRLHTVVSLIELGQSQLALSTAMKDLELTQCLADQVFDGITDPTVAALLLAKSAQASNHGVELVVRTIGKLEPAQQDERALVLILGNLIDNAFDAVADIPGPPRVLVVLTVAKDDLTICVSDNGPGVPAADVDRVFTRGWSTKEPGDATGGGRGLGLALVAQTVRRCHGTVWVESGAVESSAGATGAVESSAVESGAVESSAGATGAVESGAVESSAVESGAGATFTVRLPRIPQPQEVSQ